MLNLNMVSFRNIMWSNLFSSWGLSVSLFTRCESTPELNLPCGGQESSEWSVYRAAGPWVQEIQSGAVAKWVEPGYPITLAATVTLRAFWNINLGESLCSLRQQSFFPTMILKKKVEILQTNNWHPFLYLH